MGEFALHCGGSKLVMPHFDPPPRPPRRTRLDTMVYGLCVLLIWILTLGEVFAG